MLSSKLEICGSIRKHGWLLAGLLGMVLIAGCTPKEKELGSPTLWLEVPPKVRVGETVPLKLKLKNTTDRPVTLFLSGRPAYDFFVTKPDGTEVWRWLHGQFIQAVLERKILQPGEELEFAADWNQQDNEGRPTSPGTYWVQGVLTVMPNAMPPEQELKTKRKRLIILPSP